MVYAEPVTDALGDINGVDLAVTYGVSAGGRQVAVSAVMLRPGATITAADLTEALASMPVGLGPDVVHVVPELPLNPTTYRPIVGALRAAGIPKAGRHAWYFDPASNDFRRLTPTARAELSGRPKHADA
jgi:putative long chain acyl-CoA synthase